MLTDISFARNYEIKIHLPRSGSVQQLIGDYMVIKSIPFQDDVEVAERLPGEPQQRPRASSLRLAIMIPVRFLFVLVVCCLTFGLWPLHFLAALIWGWPLNVSKRWQILRYLRLIWTEHPPPPGLPLLVRVWLTLSVIRKVACIPVWGLAWSLDELLYGRGLDRTPVKAPLLEISAGRSGSTQLARYIMEDSRLAAPSLLQFSFPYLWLWKLAPRTIGRIFTPERVHQMIEKKLPPEFLQRHEGDPFKTDSFDGALYLTHMNVLSAYLGPRVLVEDFGFAMIAPHNHDLWEHDFVNLLDRIGRKALFLAGHTEDGSPRRLFIKGHFLCAAPALAQRFPDACFLTMIREPCSRIRSAVNYMRANPPLDMMLGATPWNWWGRTLAETETDYCDVERAWFSADDGTKRCVIRFADYVRDLEGTMTKVYRECFDGEELPSWAPHEHAPRNRTNYLLDRTLAEVGIDEAVLKERTADYIEWCRGEGAKGQTFCRNQS
jgi:hypothetical protein